MANQFKLAKKYNWETAHKALIKKYVADLYQASTDAPVATELFNNTDVAFTYEYLAVGVYGVICSKPIFSGCAMGCPPGQNTQANINNTFYYSGTSAGIVVFPVADNYMIILSTDGGTPMDDIIGHYTQNTVEVTIYPQL